MNVLQEEMQLQRGESLGMLKLMTVLTWYSRSLACHPCLWLARIHPMFWGFLVYGCHSRSQSVLSPSVEKDMRS